MTLSNNLSLVKSRFRSGASVGPATVEYVTGARSCTVTGLPAAGEDEVTVRLRRERCGSATARGTCSSAAAAARSAAKVKQTPVSGEATSTKGSFKARGR